MINRKTLSEQAYIEFTRMIMNRKFSPGEKITEERIAKMLGVSRTTVKKVFTALEKEGILVAIPRKGVFLRKYTKEEILEIFDLRTVVAELAIKYAVLNVNKKDIAYLEAIYKKMEEAVNNNDTKKYSEYDRELHESIVRFSGTSILPDIISNLYLRLRPFAQLNIRDPRETIKEHKEIVESIKAGDPERAGKAMREHILKAKEYVDLHRFDI